MRSGVSSSHLGRIERGERFPSAGTLKKIAKPLNIDVNELFILAGYLPPQSANIVGQLDPYVARLLSQESPEVQRAVIGILSLLKGISQVSNRN